MQDTSIKPKSRQGGCKQPIHFVNCPPQPAAHPQARHNSTDPSVKMDKTTKQLTAVAHHKKTSKERHSVLHVLLLDQPPGPDH